MAQIVLHIAAQPGHLNPSFKLARRLRARGHQIRFLTVADDEEMISLQGYETVLIHSERLPKGSMKRLASATARESLGIRTDLLKRSRESYVHGEVEAQLKKLAPDFILVDVLRPNLPTAFVAHKLGVPTALVSMHLPQLKYDHLPPITSSLTPDASLTTKELAWAQTRARRSLEAWNQYLRVARSDPLLHPQWLLRFAESCGYPLEEIDPRGAFDPVATKFPELVLCPRAFDFPRPDDQRTHYAEASIDLDRIETADLPKEIMRNEQPLIYVSLGTQTFHYKRPMDIVRAIIAAIAARPQLRGLVAIWKSGNTAELEAPPNVTLTNYTPQLAILERAALMITHGGLNSVKECIHSGVPMIVLPQMHEQPGNAARVAHHGLGLLGSPSPTKEEVGNMIDRILGEPSFMENMRRMQQEFQRAEAEGPSTALIEGWLAKRPTIPAPVRAEASAHRPV